MTEDGGALHGRPTAAELVTAVREWLAAVLADGRPPGSYDVRVAVAALQVVERELVLGPPPPLDHAAVAAAVRAGEPVGPELRAALLADVEAALRVSNPRHLER